MKLKLAKIKRNNRAFVILFAVVLSSILLAITLGVLKIALQETNFGTSAKDTNDAFYAADTAAECSLFNDKSNSGVFVSGGGSSIQCLGTTINLSGTFPSWSFVLYGLGSQSRGCSKVTVLKDNTDPQNIKTQIVAKGYNSGGDGGACTPGARSVERALEFNY